MTDYQIHVLPSFERSFSLIRYRWKYKYYLTNQQIFAHTHDIYKSVMSLKKMPREYPLVTDQFKLLDYPTRILVINQAYSLLYRIHDHDIEIGMMFSNHQKRDWLKF